MDVLLYTWPKCGFCQRAKDLLDAADVEWREHSLAGDRAFSQRLARRFGRATMPYVLLDGEPLGGLDELSAWLQARI
ncbi:MAG: glutaredoxin domain-containing protein [Planctomycetota bacterium]